MSVDGEKQQISIAVVGFDDDVCEEIMSSTQALGFAPQSIEANELIKKHNTQLIENPDVLLMQKNIFAQLTKDEVIHQKLLERRLRGKFNGIFGLPDSATCSSRQSRLFHAFLKVQKNCETEQKKILLNFFENVRFFLKQSQL